jgi:nitrogen-specific signal transduction histidine kinase
MSSLATLQHDAEFASAEVLGTLAHELRQPLSNIEAVAYYLKMILPAGDARIQAQLARIRVLVEQSNWILSNALSLAASIPVVPQAVALEELITHSVISSGAQAEVRLVLDGDLPLVHLDPRDGRELVDSLLMLFRTMADGAGPVTVTTSAGSEGGVMMEIRTPGNSSPSVAGSQLALERARRIALAHAGTLEMDSSDPAGGIRARLMLP